MATEKIFIAVEIEGGKAVKSLADIKSQMKALRDSNTNLNKALKNGSISLKQYGAAASKNDVALKRLSASYREATNAASGLTKAGLRFRDKMAQGLTRSLKQVGAAIAGAFALRAVIQGISSTVDIIKDFDQANANLAAVLGKTKNDMDALSSSAKELGATTSFTASQVVELQTELAKLGFTEREILNATKSVLALAEASGADLAQAAKVAGSTIRAFGLDAKDAARVADVMAKSFSSSALDIGKFEVAMKSVAPVAGELGFTLEETTAQLGMLVNSGIDASTAGTALRGILLDNVQAGRSLSESMDLINNSTDKAKTAFELFNKRGAASALVLAANVEASDELTISLQNSGGAAERMARTQLDTLEGKTKLLTSAWEGFVLSLDAGDSLISNLIGGFLSLTTAMLGGLTTQEKLSGQLVQTNVELNTQFALLKDTNITQDERSILIENINAKYKDYLPNLLKESSTLKEIEEAQRGANVALRDKILLVATQERLVELTKAAVEADKARFDILEKLAKIESGETTFKTEVRGGVVSTAKSQKATLLKILNDQLAETLIVTEAATKRVSDFQKRNAELLATDIEESSKKTLEVIKADINASKELNVVKREEIDILIKKAELQKEVAADRSAGLVSELEERTDFENKLRNIDEEALNDKFNTAFAAADALRNLANVTTENKLRDLDKEFQDEMALINKRERDESLTEQQADQERRKLAEDSDKKAEALERKIFNRNKVLNIATATADIAVAVIKALKSAPPPANFITAGITGAIGGVQIASIAAQKFAQGGIIEGASHANGGVSIMGGRAEVEGNEVILTKGVTENPSLLAAASQLNVMGGGQRFFQQGGVLDGLMPNLATQNNSNANLIEALEGLTIQSEVSVVEILSGINSVRTSEANATI